MGDDDATKTVLPITNTVKFTFFFAVQVALSELQSEVRESFDQHAAIENHEHLVHHLGHEDTDHEIHHSHRHLEHLEQVHGKTIAGATPIEHHKPHSPEEKVDMFSFHQST
jgi:hypothetical protein